MGLADFLAEAGRGAPMGAIGQAFGGRTSQQREMEGFINNQLPTLVDQLNQATTKEDVMRAGQALIGAGLKAGMNPQGLDKVMEMTVGPALQNLQTGEINKFREDLQGVPASPRPQGGNELVKGPDVPAVPGRPIDTEMAVRFGQAIGANPQHMINLLSTPAEIAGKELSNKKTQSQLDAEQARESAIQGLSSDAQAPGLPSTQAVARINPAGIVQFLPQRDKPEDPLLEERRNLLNAQIAANNALAGLRGVQSAQGGTGGGGQATTTTERAVNPTMQAEAARQIAQAAKDRNMTSAEDIKKIAEDFGYTIEGNPTIEDSLFSAFGVTTPKLGGVFRMTPKDLTKTTTKGTQPTTPTQPKTPTQPQPANGQQTPTRGQAQAATAQPQQQETPEQRLRNKFNLRGK